MRGVVVALLLVLACGGDRETPTRLRATIVRPANDSVRDTVRFDTPADARRCRDGSGLLLAGARAGNGVLLLLRPGDSAAGHVYPALARGDTASRRGALVAVRFRMGEVARGLTLDSGDVTVRPGRDEFDAAIHGWGIGVPGAQRITVDATFERVPVAPAELTSCAAEP